MQALVFDKVGAPGEVLRVVEMARPQPAAGEVLVKVGQRPIHPADLAFIRGQYRVRPRLPQVAGLEGSGSVIDGDGIAAGVRVAFRWPGAWADYVSVPIDRIIAVPSGIDDDVACQISLNPITAWALLNEARVAADDTILLTAAASTVSAIVSAIARRRGIHVIGLVRGDPTRTENRSGAARLLSITDADLSARIVAAGGGHPIAALIDSVGGPLIERLLPMLAPGAHVIAYGVQDQAPTAVTNATLIYSNLTWKGFGIDRWLAAQGADVKSQMLDQLWTMVQDHSLPLPVAARYPLADFFPALSTNAAMSRNGKVLLVSK